MDTLYTLHNVVQRFGAREILNIPSLTLKPGIIYGLLGPNGAGKTTLMRILAFMDNPVAGAVSFMGEPVRQDQAARHRARVVWVPQWPVMFTGSVLYNIEYPMRLKKTPQVACRQKALELLETVALAHLAKAPARRLSGGEAQRASIARALAAGAEVILFDEPTASVDFRSRGEIVKLIRLLNHERRLSLIVTTHDAELAAALCKERITLFDGRIVPRYPQSDENLAGGVLYAAPPWPGRLSKQAHAWQVHLPKEVSPGLSSSGSPARLTALEEEDSGVRLRLARDSGEILAICISDSEGMNLAVQLTLGSCCILFPDLPA